MKVSFCKVMQVFLQLFNLVMKQPQQLYLSVWTSVCPFVFPSNCRHQSKYVFTANSSFQETNQWEKNCVAIIMNSKCSCIDYKLFFFLENHKAEHSSLEDHNHAPRSIIQFILSQLVHFLFVSSSWVFLKPTSRGG